MHGKKQNRRNYAENVACGVTSGESAATKTENPSAVNKIKHAVSENEDLSTRKGVCETSAMPKVENAAAPGVSRELIGRVVNCGRLNVRQQPKPDAVVVTALDVGSEVMIDMTGSTDAFFRIWTTAGIEGYCMKQYVKLEA